MRPELLHPGYLYQALAAAEAALLCAPNLFHYKQHVPYISSRPGELILLPADPSPLPFPRLPFCSLFCSFDVVFALVLGAVRSASLCDAGEMAAACLFN